MPLMPLSILYESSSFTINRAWRSGSMSLARTALWTIFKVLDIDHFHYLMSTAIVPNCKVIHQPRQGKPMATDDFSDLDDLTMDLNDLTAVDDALEAATIHPTFTMGVEYANPHDLRPNPWNPNAVDPINQQKLEASLRRDGIKRPIVVRQLENDDYQIIGGQHRTQAAIELGWKEVPIINRGKISDAEAKRETLLDNFRYGSDNLDRLAALLSDPDIGDAASLLDTMPIDDEELDEYFSHLKSETVDLDIEDALDDGSEKPEDDDEDETIDLATGKPVKTHTIIRFRVSVEDQAKLAELMKQTKITHGYVASDDLTNDGDALIHLIRDQFV
ncbi:ParB-like nuclease domain protein [Pseudomonas phage phiK7B1]|nr:ParB-like nuclease domain protein [Pseudomonas phage phiK7B1]